MEQSNNRNSGFTLIELLVVITIILVLTGLGVVSYTAAQRSARDSKRKADLEQVRSALEMYRDDNDVYPDGDWSDAEIALIGGNYLDSMPEDPSGYSYYYNGPPDTPAGAYTYSLCAYLEGGDGGCGSNSCGTETCNYQVNNP